MYVKDRLRRSMMFVPGNNPGMIRDAHIYGADSIMFDLEDSVAYTEKDTARFLVYNALKTLHFGSKETVVRINDLSSGLGIKDLEAVVRAGVQVVRLPKTDSAQDVIDCEREIQRIEQEMSSLLVFAAQSEKMERFEERFKAMTREKVELAEKLEKLEASVRQEKSRSMEVASPSLSEFDEDFIRRVVEQVTVISESRIEVRFVGGFSKVEEIPK